MIEFTEKITRFLVFLRIIDEIKNIDAFYNSFVENQLVFKFLKLIPKINRILKKLKTFQQLIEEIIEIEDPFYMNFKNGVNWKDFFNKNSNIFEAETLSKEKLILLISDYFFKIKK